MQSSKDLKREIQVLKRRVKALESERAVYLRTVHAWAKQRHTQMEVERLFRGKAALETRIKMTEHTAGRAAAADIVSFPL